MKSVFAALAIGYLMPPVLAQSPGVVEWVPCLAQADEPTEEWTSLIGEGLAGWTVNRPNRAGHWDNIDGIITGHNPDKRGSILWTDKDDYTDFELYVEYRTTTPEDYDSGIFIRAESHQVQMGVSRSLQKDMTASIYCPKDGDGSYPAETDEEAIAEQHRVGDWNTLRIVVRGNNIQTFLNDAEICDYPTKTMPDSGKIGLQLHGGVDMRMEFRVVKLRELEAQSE